MPARPDIARLLDANANRAREALRVLEDAARFVLDDAALAGACKRLRHDLAAALRGLPGAPVELSRDTPGDVGTAIRTDAEGRRGSLRDVVVAAGKRLGEALRCCEEYGKLLDAAFARRIEQLRYGAYHIEGELIARLTLPDPRTWRVCVLITESLCTHHAWRDVARAALAGGADCLQLREKRLADAELLDRAAALVAMGDEPKRGAAAPAAIIINDRPDIALLAGAHGAHLGAGDLPVAPVRKALGRSLLLGASTHNLRQARAAVNAGADYCGVGAVFASTTKRHKPSGIEYLKRYLRDFADTPHLAIGGIAPENIDQLVDVGARAVAVSACVCSAKHPDRVVKKLRRALSHRDRG